MGHFWIRGRLKRSVLNSGLNLEKSTIAKMSGGEVAKIARPQMRGLLNSVIKKRMVAAFSLATVTTSLYYYFVFRDRRLAYKKFYENYDPDREYERMKKTGIFQNFPKEEDEEE